MLGELSCGLIIIAEMFFAKLFAVTVEGGGGGGGATARFAVPLLSSIACLGGGGGLTFGGFGDGRGCAELDRELVCESDRCSEDRFWPPVGGCGAWPLWAGIAESLLLAPVL